MMNYGETPPPQVSAMVVPEPDTFVGTTSHTLGEECVGIQGAGDTAVS